MSRSLSLQHLPDAGDAPEPMVVRLHEGTDEDAPAQLAAPAASPDMSAHAEQRPLLALAGSSTHTPSIVAAAAGRPSGLQQWPTTAVASGRPPAGPQQPSASPSQTPLPASTPVSNSGGQLPPMHSGTPGGNGSGSGVPSTPGSAGPATKRHAPLAFLASFNSSFTYEQRDQALPSPVTSGALTGRNSARRSLPGPLTNPLSSTHASLASSHGGANAAPVSPAAHPPTLLGTPSTVGHVSWPDDKVGVATALDATTVASPASSGSASACGGVVDVSGIELMPTTSSAATARGMYSSRRRATDADEHHHIPLSSVAPSSSSPRRAPINQVLVSEAPSLDQTPEKTPQIPNKTLLPNVGSGVLINAANVGTTAGDAALHNHQNTSNGSSGRVSARSSPMKSSRRVHDTTTNSTRAAAAPTKAATFVHGNAMGKVTDPSGKLPAVDEDSKPSSSTSAPLTRLRFHTLFLLLTIVVVVICCFFVWYLGDSNARRIVANLSREIRGDVLHKVQSRVTRALIDVLSAADQLYTAMDAQPAFVNVLRTESSVSPFNVSYLFHLSVTLARFTTVPALGIMTSRDVLLTVRRPALVQGYLNAASSSGNRGTTISRQAASCDGGNDGSGGCLYSAVPELSLLLSDPDDVIDFGIREYINISAPSTAGFDPAQSMGNQASPLTANMWSFNLRKYNQMFGSGTGVDTSWDPLHAESSFPPFFTGAQTSARLRGYADGIYAQAIAAGVPPALAPPNSTSTRPVFGTYPDYKVRPVYADGLALGGRLGWTRPFIAANNQIVIGAVKARMNTGAAYSDQYPITFVVYSFMYFESLNANILEQLEATFRARKDVAQAECFVFERGGRLVASTVSLEAQGTARGRTNLLTSDHELISALRDPLVQSGLIQPATAGEDDTLFHVNVSAAVRPENKGYDSLVLDQAFRAHGKGWHLRAAPITSSLGLRWVAVVITLDSDFDGDFARNSITTAWLSALVGLVAIMVTLLVVQCLTRPLLKLVNIMEEISSRLLNAKDDPAKQNADLVELRSLWQASVEKPHLLMAGKSIDEELRELRRRRRKAEKASRARRQKEAAAAQCAAASRSTPSQPKSSLIGSGAGSGGASSQESPLSGSRSCVSNVSDSDEAATAGGAGQRVRDRHHQAAHDGASSAAAEERSSGPHALARERPPKRSRCQRYMRAIRRFCCSRLPHCFERWLPTLPLQETQLLHRTFSACLTGLASSHEQLQTANESKRRFIRYIFHEVRVPFNAIVLGVEQLREDLYSEPLRPTEEMQDVVSILNEQSKVVSRILNDVLSLQKIEDGALQLEMAPFNLIEMVCGTLRSFQPLLAEKNLILMTEMEDVDQAIVRRHREIWLAEQKAMAEQAAAKQRAAAGGVTTDEQKSSDAADPNALTGVRIDSLGPPSIVPGAITNLHPPIPSLVSAAPLSTTITPSPPSAGGAGGTNIYANAYEDSKELQRIAEMCSREVYGDRYRLRQVLANFLSNSIKFTPAGGTIVVRVTCTLLEGEDGGEFDSPDAPPVAGAATTSPKEPAAVAAAALVPLLPPGQSQVQGSPTTTDTGALATPSDALGSAAASSPAAPGATPGTVSGSPQASNGMASPSADGAAAPAATATAVPAVGSDVEMPLTSRWKPPRRVCMRVSVSDSGRGLNSKELPLLFQPYVQFQSGEQQQGKGTGLGLNISKSLITLHGGEIGVLSEGIPGKGCEFFFAVPMEVVPASHADNSRLLLDNQYSPLQRGRVSIAGGAATSQTSRSASLVRQRSMQSNSSVASPIISGGLTLSADAALSVMPGLRTWHSPRSTARHLHAMGPSGSESPSMTLLRRIHATSAGSPGMSGLSSSATGSGRDTSVAAEAAQRLSSMHPSLDSDGNYHDLFSGNFQHNMSGSSVGSGSASATGGGAAGSTSSTPVLGLRRVLHPRGSRDARGGSRDLGLGFHSQGSVTGDPEAATPVAAEPLASFVPIVPTGSDTGSNLQYISQLNFLNELALQGQGLSGSSTAGAAASSNGTLSVRVSPLQQYRATVLNASVPYGAGYDHAPRSAAFPVDGILPEDLSDMPKRTGPPLPPTAHSRVASTPASSPHLHPTSLAQASSVSQGVFSTSPFVAQHRHVSSADLNEESDKVSALATPNLPSSSLSSSSSGSSSTAASATSTLPAPTQTASSATVSTPASAAASPVGPQRPKVLVAEDSIPNRKLLMMLLRTLKCDPFGADNGLQAVAEFDASAGASMDSLQAAMRSGAKSANIDKPGTKGHEWALVLMDGNMPVCDGMTATKAIRSLGWRVPIVAVTGNALDEDTKSFRAAGANEVISKPCGRKQLEAMLARYLHQKGGASQSSSPPPPPPATMRAASEST